MLGTFLLFGLGGIAVLLILRGLGRAGDSFMNVLRRVMSLKLPSLLTVLGFSITACGGSSTGPSALPSFVVILDSCTTASLDLTMYPDTGAQTTKSVIVAASPDSVVFDGLRAGHYALGLFGSWPGVTGPYAGLVANDPSVTVPGRDTITCTGGRPARYVVTLHGTTATGGCLVQFAVGDLLSDGDVASGTGPTIFGAGVSGSVNVTLGQVARDTVFLPPKSYTGGATVLTGYSAPYYTGYTLPQWDAPVPGSVDLSC